MILYRIPVVVLLLCFCGWTEAQVTCPPGSYLEVNTGQCADCAIGTFQSNAGMSSCTSCPPGDTTINNGSDSRFLCYKICDAGNYFHVGVDECRPCQIGYYETRSGQVRCTACEPRQTTASVGSNSSVMCFINCDSGFEAFELSECIPCVIGFYRDKKTSLNCTVCPSGFTTLGENSTSIADCEFRTCDPGYIRSANGAGCEACPLGYYQDRPNQSVCNRCGDGLSTIQVASTSVDQCENACPIGKGKLTDSTLCTDCPFGYYKDNTQNLIICTKCPEFFSTPIVGSTSILDCSLPECNTGFEPSGFGTCTPCQRGYYRTAGVHAYCQPCPDGFITSSIRSQSIEDCNVADCDAGSSLDLTSNRCVPCPIGTYQNLVWQTSCNICGDRYRTDTVGATSQDQCRFFCDSGYQNNTLNCELCPYETYRDNAIDGYYSPCQPCPTGYRTQNPGATSRNQCSIIRCEAGYIPNSLSTACQPCSIGYYQPLRDETVCFACGDGFSTRDVAANSFQQCERYCPAGEKLDGATNTCAPCPVGYYKDNTINKFSTCIACPSLYVTLSDRSTSARNCTCQSGFEESSFLRNCEQCEIGYYRTAGEHASCTRCPVDYITPTVQSVSQLDCSIADCTIGYRLDTLSKRCVACPIGTYQNELRQTTCKPCGDPPERYRTDNVASTNQQQCNFFCESGFQARGTTCEICRYDTYRDNLINGYYSQCLNCPFGFRCLNAGCTRASQCNIYRCNVGYMSNTIRNGCIPCSLGYYQDKADQMDCVQCAVGFSTINQASTSFFQCERYCPAGEQIDINTNRCTICDVGYYKDNAISLFHTCTKCPEESTTVTFGSTSIDNCTVVVCRSGLELSSFGNCQPCQIGFYRTSGIQDGCTACPPGYITSGNQSVSVANCSVVACGVGTRRDVLRNECVECPIGTYQNETWETTCKSCGGANYRTDQIGSTRRTQCKFFCSSGYQAISSSSCEICSVDTYRDNIIDGYYSRCQKCPTGYLTSSAGATRVSQCNRYRCSAGYKANAFQNGCDPCPIGFYQNLSDQTDCFPCGINQSTRSVGSTSQLQCESYCPPGEERDGNTNTCSPCAIGFYKDTRFSLCTRCPDSYTTNGTRSTTIFACSTYRCGTGYKPNRFNTECEACPLGYYQDRPDQVDCNQCAIDLSTRTEASTSVQQCESYCPSGEEKDLFTGRCRVCQVGYYKDNSFGLFTTCTRCTPPFTTSSNGSTSAAACSVRVCESGFEVNGAGDCVLCDIGLYRTAGLHAVCTPCDQDFITLRRGSTTESDCSIVACRIGYRRDITNNRCVICPIGTYQDQKWQTTCNTCGVRYRTDREGATNISECRFFCESGYQDILFACQICSRDTYRDNIFNGYYSQCQQCPSNYRTPNLGSRNISQCSIYRCQTGYKQNATRTGCDPCPVGYYQNQTDQAVCIQCPINTSTRIEAATSEPQCEYYCPPGEEKESFSNVCNQCLVGTYKDNIESLFSPCTPCPGNFTTYGTGSTSVSACYVPICSSGMELSGSLNCILCQIGYYRTAGDHDRCQPCPIGYITPGNGSYSRFDCSIVECEVGYMRNVTNNYCVPCPIGSYQDKIRQTTCKSCGGDRYRTDVVASTRQQDCIFFCESGYEAFRQTCRICPYTTYRDNTNDGYYSQCQNCRPRYRTLTPGATSATQCVIYRCNVGYKSNAFNTGCEACRVGYYQDQQDQQDCIPCGEGRSTRTEASTSPQQCERYCPPGEERDPFTGNCRVCPVGYYKDNSVSYFNTCTSCPPSLTTAGVQSTSIDACSLRVCESGFEVTGTNDCTACKIGFYRTNGVHDICMPCADDAFTTDTTGSTSPGDCNIVACETGSRRNIQRNVCELCPIGTYQDEPLQTSCTSCGDRYRTDTEGATSSQQCIFFCGSGYEDIQSTCYICQTNSYRDNIIDGYYSLCQQCPSNYRTRDPGARYASQCRIYLCEAGYKQSIFGAGCDPCPVGYYQDQPDQPLCIQCPANQTTRLEASTSPLLCERYCPSGQEKDVFSNLCNPCPIGSFKDNTVSRLSNCTRCPEFITTESTGSTSVSACYIPLCNSGYELSGSLTCVPCQIGYYRTSGIHDVCQRCPNGYITPGTGSYFSAECTIAECPIGYKLNTNNNENCVPCPIGTYQDEARQTTCKSCGGERYRTDQEASTSRENCTFFCESGQEAIGQICQICSTTTYRDNINDGYYSQCQNCRPGFMSPNEGATAPTQCTIYRCSPGNKPNAFNTGCEACRFGYYQDQSDQQDCIQCGVGKSTRTEASTSVQQCESYCPSGEETDPFTGNCRACPVGLYKNNSINLFSTCIRCPESFTTADVRSTSVNDCVIRICDSGFELSGSYCNPCSIGYYRTLGIDAFCVPCPPGYITPGTHSTSRGDCSVADCGRGFRRDVRIERCVECPVGTYQDKVRQTSCTSCGGERYRTNSTGSTSKQDCIFFCESGYEAVDETCQICLYYSYRDNVVDGYYSQCKNCPVKRRTAASGASYVNQCTILRCDVGYKPNGLHTACDPCPLGFYQDRPDETDCIPCESGTSTRYQASTIPLLCESYCPPGEEKNIATGTCTDCGVGYYKNNSISLFNSCTRCPSFYTTATNRSTSVLDCSIRVCESGFEVSGVLDCIACQIGFFRTQGIHERCIPCPRDFITNSTQAVSEADCRIIACGVGYKRDIRRNICLQCPIGTYQDEELQTDCKSCGGDRYRTDDRASTSDRDCKFFCESGSQKVGQTCQLCRYDTYRDNLIDGFYSSCQDCPSGYRSPDPGALRRNQCTIYRCPAGNIPHTTKPECVACPPGFYQDQPDQVICTTCPDGQTTRYQASTSVVQCETFCPSGEEKGTATNDCTVCPIGSFKDNEFDIFARCTPCPGGLTTSSDRSTSEADCSILDCPSGTEPGGARQCVLCQIGYYRTRGPHDDCQPCPSDYITPTTGATSRDACTIVDCGRGYRRDVTLNVCEECPIGTYQDQIRKPSCKSCGGQRYRTDQTGSDHRNDCKFFCESGYQNVSITCQICPVGTYRDNIRDGYYSRCKNCPYNFRTPNAGALSISQCTTYLCNAGYQPNSLKTDCEPCPIGYYQDKPNQPDCRKCNVDFSTRDVASVSVQQCERYCPPGEDKDPNTGQCFPCIVGYYKDNRDSVFTSCTKCPDPFVTLGTRSTSMLDCSIRDCPAGSKIQADNQACEWCPVDTYQPDIRRRICLNCPSGMSTRTTRSTECEKYCPSGEALDADISCVPCDAGYYKDNTVDKFSPCSRCPPGMTTLGTSTTSLQDCSIRNCQAGTYIDGQECVPCPIGQYQPDKWQTRCLACPSDTLTEQQGSTSITDCQLKCRPGFEVIGGVCTACQIAFYKPEYEAILCTACPNGTRTAERQATSRTDCSIAACYPGFYRDIALNKCMACPIDQYQDRKWQDSCIHCAAGLMTISPAASSLTQCVPICSDGYEVNMDAECQPCGTHYYKGGTLRHCLPCTNGLVTGGPADGKSHDDCTRSPCLTGHYFSKTNVKECQPCPINTYQSLNGTFSCNDCPVGTRTYSSASILLSDCISVCDTDLNDCSSDATCSINNRTGLECHCKEDEGYYGNGRFCTHLCDTANYCVHGTCIVGTVGSPAICHCDEYHTGEKCQFQKDSRQLSSRMYEIIIGCVIGSVLFCVLVMTLIICYLRKIRRKDVTKDSSYNTDDKASFATRISTAPHDSFTGMKRSRSSSPAPWIPEIYSSGLENPVKPDVYQA